MPFTPAYPSRPPVAPGPLTMLKMARRNLLAIWPESTFHRTHFEHNLFRRRIFVCNSPELVREVFVEDAANVMRKSSQQVHALKPLIGDGLFISDGELWQQRRKVIAPLTHVSRLAEFVPAVAAAAAERAAIWRANAGAEIDVLTEMAEMTADVICRAIFGSRLGHRHAAEVVRGFSAFQAAVGQTDLMSLLGLPEFLPRPNGKRVRESHKVPFTYDPDVPVLIGQRCTELERGARMVEALITNTLLPEIGREILNRLVSGTPAKRVHVSTADGKFKFAYD